MLVSGVQFVDHHTHSSLLPAVLALVGAAAGGGLLLFILNQTVPRIKGRFRARAARRRAVEAAATSELRSRTQMDELCPHGWRAQMMVFSSAADLPPEAPDPDRTRVVLEWAVLGPGATSFGERRIWSDSVTGALQSMVADRMTDETLQEIELQALADGAEWPDEPASA